MSKRIPVAGADVILIGSAAMLDYYQKMYENAEVETGSEPSASPSASPSTAPSEVPKDGDTEQGLSRAPEEGKPNSDYEQVDNNGNRPVLKP